MSSFHRGATHPQTVSARVHEALRAQHQAGDQVAGWLLEDMRHPRRTNCNPIDLIVKKLSAAGGGDCLSRRAARPDRPPYALLAHISPQKETTR